MLLMKRTQKDQHSSDLMHDSTPESHNVSIQKPKSSSFLYVPGLFVGFNPWSGDSYSVRSPTSPLDFRIFSSFGNPFRSPKSLNEEQKKSWERSKVGLSIIDSLDDPTKPSEKLSPVPSANKNIVFGPKMSVGSSNFASHFSSVMAPKSLPKHITALSMAHRSPGVVFEIGDGNLRSRSLDSGERGSHFANLPNRKSRFGSQNLIPENNLAKPITSEEPMKWRSSSPTSSDHISVTVDSISASEIENSEDYTRVITHGPNPKVTHIFADRVLECNSDKLPEFVRKHEDNTSNHEDVHLSYDTEDFLKYCDSCQKKLDGEDIYMYRGEKAFCSENCRIKVIEIDEDMDKIEDPSSETSGEISISESGPFITT